MGAPGSGIGSYFRSLQDTDKDSVSLAAKGYTLWGNNLISKENTMKYVILFTSNERKSFQSWGSGLASGSTNPRTSSAASLTKFINLFH
jgi:hypothetical protein